MVHNFLDGEDFIGGEFRVSFPATVDEACAHIPVLDDNTTLEGTEIFLVVFDTLELPDGVLIGSINTTTVSIIDDDSELIIA